MSRQLALDTINLKSVTRIAHTGYSMAYHDTLHKKLTGVRLDHSKPDQKVLGRYYDALGFDFLFYNNDGLHSNWKERGRTTDMGHAEYKADGSDRREPAKSPFETCEDVYAFDPSSEYGVPDFREQVAAYNEALRKRREDYPNQLSPGGYYKTLISGAIQAFGWDMLLLAAAEEKRFEKTLDRFFRFTLHHMQAWAATDAEAVIQHDDFVWTNGPFMNPEFYRKAIIPRFAELWKPLRRAGKKVLFCSDGNFMEFVPDILSAGADGLIFEPLNDFEIMAGRFGKETCLIGSAVDCRDMTFNKWDKVKADMDRTFELSAKCKGLVFAVGNHIPANVPDDMCERYLAYFAKNRDRG